VTDKERQELLQQFVKKQKTDKLKPTERYEIPVQDMPEQDPIERRANVNEVATGYTETHARLEAMRCLQCKKAPCIKGCPVQIRIQDFVAAISDGDFKKALAIIKENSLLPAVCGRVCPQEVQCQQTCTVGLKFKDPTKAVSIGRLERFVADLDQDNESVPAVAAETGMKVRPSQPRQE
jgi:glutamate synthase (NADPH/NADH) small chain